MALNSVKKHSRENYAFEKSLTNGVHHLVTTKLGSWRFLICLYKLLVTANVFWQYEQTNGRSPVCILTWRSSSPLEAQIFLQALHVYLRRDSSTKVLPIHPAVFKFPEIEKGRINFTVNFFQNCHNFTINMKHIRTQNNRNVLRWAHIVQYLSQPNEPDPPHPSHFVRSCFKISPVVEHCEHYLAVSLLLNVLQMFMNLCCCVNTEGWVGLSVHMEVCIQR